MAEDLGRLTLTTQLVDEATTPLLKLKRTVNESLDSMAASTVKTAEVMGKGVGGVAGAFKTAGTGILGAAKGIASGIGVVAGGVMSVVRETSKIVGIASAALLTTGIVKAQEIISKGFLRVTAIQDATAQSAVLMGGDMAKAAAFIEQIRDVVTGTPFSLPDFAKAGQEMLMYGIEAEKIPGILTAVGEATAGSGAKAVENASQMTTVLSKMAATGKVSLDDMWSMSAVGVPALTILANGMGLTTEAMKKLISTGAVPAKEAIDIMVKGIMEGSTGVAGTTASFAGSMSALAKTWSGSLMIFDSAKGILGAKFIDPLKDAMPGIVTAMSEIMRSMGGFAVPWTAFIQSSGVLPKIEEKLLGISTWIKKIADNWGAVTAKFDGLGPVLIPIAAAFAAMGATSLAPMLGPLGALVPALSPLLVLVAALVASSPVLRDVFVGAWKQLLEVMAPLQSTFKQVGDLLMGVFNQAIGAIAPALQSILTAIVPLIPMLLNMAMILISALAPILPIVITFLANIAQILIGALAEAIIALVPPLIGFVMLLIEKLSPILPVIFSALTQLLNIFMPLIPIIVEIAGVVLELATVFIATLLPPLMQLIPIVLQLAMSIGQELMKVLMAIMPPLLELLMALMPLIPPLAEIIAMVLKLAIDCLTPILPIISSVASFIVTLLTAAIKDAMPFIKDLIKFITDLATLMVDKLQPVLSVIGGMFKGIASFIGDVVRGIGDFLKAGFDQVAGFVKFITGGASGGAVLKAMGGGLTVRHMAAGGVLGGYSPGKDTIPAMLSPGEAVLVPELVRALGASNIMAANFAYSGGRPAMAGSGDRTGGNPQLSLGGGGTQVTVIVSAGAVQISTSGGVDADEIRGALETVLADSARRAY